MNSRQYAEAILRFLEKEGVVDSVHDIMRHCADLATRSIGPELTITTAASLGAHEEQQVRQAAQEQGMRSVRFVVDPEVMGGVVVQAGDRRIDHSVGGALERLRDSLQKS